MKLHVPGRLEKSATFKLTLADPSRKLIGLVMRKPQEFIEKAEFVHDAQRRWVNRVAAKVTQKVGVFSRTMTSTPARASEIRP